MRRPRTPIERSRDGTFRLRLSAPERDVLRSLPRQLQGILDTGDPTLRRLTPPGYPDDPDLEREYRDLVGDDLRRQREEALHVLERTADADRLDEEQLAAWLRALNDIRLVLGTRLDVTEDLDLASVRPDDPRATELGLYGYLTWVQEAAVEALAAELPQA